MLSARMDIFMAYANSILQFKKKKKKMSLKAVKQLQVSDIWNELPKTHLYSIKCHIWANTVNYCLDTVWVNC